jgi:hypothetical protein
MVILMSTARETHPSDDVLELYSLGRMDEGQSAPVEEHLLVCEACRRRVEEFDEFTAAMRAALTEMKAPEPEAESWTARLGRLVALPKPVWAGALAATLALVLLLPWQGGNQAPFAVQLETVRQAAAAAAPADRPLLLTVDLTGLAVDRDYRLEIVDASGRLVWRTTTRSATDKAVVSLNKGLKRGGYWVRIYEAGGELLREFGLKID